MRDFFVHILTMFKRFCGDLSYIKAPTVAPEDDVFNVKSKIFNRLFYDSVNLKVLLFFVVFFLI